MFSIFKCAENRLNLRLHHAQRAGIMPILKGTLKRVNSHKLAGKAHKHTLATSLCIFAKHELSLEL